MIEWIEQLKSSVIMVDKAFFCEPSPIVITQGPEPYPSGAGMVLWYNDKGSLYPQFRSRQEFTEITSGFYLLVGNWVTMATQSAMAHSNGRLTSKAVHFEVAAYSVWEKLQNRQNWETRRATVRPGALLKNASDILSFAASVVSVKDFDLIREDQCMVKVGPADIEAGVVGAIALNIYVKLNEEAALRFLVSLKSFVGMQIH